MFTDIKAVKWFQARQGVFTRSRPWSEDCKVPSPASPQAELAAQFGEKWEAALRPVLTGKDFTACLSKVHALRGRS